MQRLPLKMWLKNVASGCGSITQRIKNGLHFYFILACCFSFFFMFMLVPVSASVPESDKSYFVVLSYDSSYGKTERIFYSDYPLKFTTNNTYLTAISSVPEGTFIHHYRIIRYDGEWSGYMGPFKASDLIDFNNIKYDSTLSVKDANYDVYVNGKLLFQKPGEEVVPEGLWTALYNLIAQNALVIVGIVGVLLIALWISLRLLVRCFRIFSTPSKNSRR